jgi:hypothetical protein
MIPAGRRVYDKAAEQRQELWEEILKAEERMAGKPVWSVFATATITELRGAVREK